jgi:DNA-binding MarR family transcriptional regulator
LAQAGKPAANNQPTGRWVFLTNHAHVLLCIARDPQARTRDIAEQVGITERATQRILAELRAEGYVTRTKVGRRNRYTINTRGHLRHPIFRNLAIGPLLDVLNTAEEFQPRRAAKKSAKAGPSAAKRGRA